MKVCVSCRRPDTTLNPCGCSVANPHLPRRTITLDMGNPLIGTAAEVAAFRARIAALSAERDRYKAALEEIGRSDETDGDFAERFREARMLARAALRAALAPRTGGEEGK